MVRVSPSSSYLKETAGWVDAGVACREVAKGRTLAPEASPIVKDPPYHMQVCELEEDVEMLEEVLNDQKRSEGVLTQSARQAAMERDAALQELHLTQQRLASQRPRSSDGDSIYASHEGTYAWPSECKPYNSHTWE